MTTVFSGRFGVDVGETPQTVVAADGRKPLLISHVLIDSDSAYNTGTGEFVVPRTGIYHINWQTHAKNAPTSTPGLSFVYRNGVEIANGSNINSSGSDEGSPTSLYVGCLVTGDVITFVAEYNFSSTLTGYAYIYQVADTPFSIATYPTLTAPRNTFFSWQAVCDQPNWIDPSDPTKFVVTTTGYYVIAFQEELSGTTLVSERQTKIYVNGSYANYHQVSQPQGATNVPLTTVIHLDAGDEVQVWEDITTANSYQSTAQIMIYLVPSTFHGALAQKSSQTNSSSFAVPFSFTGTAYDTDGYWSSGSPTLLTIPSGRGGTYLVWSGFTGTILRGVNPTLNGGVESIESGTGGGVNNNRLMSPTNTAVWQLASGDSIVFYAQTGDTPYTLTDIHCGLMQIDGWTYADLKSCPCPRPVTGFVPQIYRRI